MNTEMHAEQIANVPAAQRLDLEWYHVCYCWSVIAMASFMLARASAQKTAQTLFYVQAIDQPVTVMQLATEESFYEKLFP